MRDYFCSKISKGSYCYHPVDLLILSGILSVRHEVQVLDAVVQRLKNERTFSLAKGYKPDVIVFLTGAVSFHGDGPFLKELKQATGARMVGLGDIFLEKPERVFELWPWLDAALLDFTTPDILDLVESANKISRNAVVRSPDGQLIRLPVVQTPGAWGTALPRHDMFSSLPYSFPFARKKRFATVLTNFGCPYSCTYCPTGSFLYKERPLGSIAEELDSLQALGISEIFFKDQSFGPGRERIAALCRELTGRKWPFGWTCFLRPEMADEKVVGLMAAAGCHTIIFGVESGEAEVRRLYGREYSDNILREAFAACRKFGVETVATFVMGLPGESTGSLDKTIALARELDCDYASFNIFVPAYGTALRKKLIDQGVVTDELAFMDSAVSKPYMSTALLPAEELWKMHRRAVWSFYGRPGFLIKRLLGAGSWGRMFRMWAEGWSVMSARRNA